MHIVTLRHKHIHILKIISIDLYPRARAVAPWERTNSAYAKSWTQSQHLKKKFPQISKAKPIPDNKYAKSHLTKTHTVKLKQR